MEKTHKFNDYDLMLNPTNPNGKDDFEINNPLVSEFDEIFSSLKGEPKTLRSDQGKLHLPYVIDFKSNKKNLKVFKKKINQNNGTVILLIDGSGSMRNSSEDRPVRNLTANLYKAISEISRLDLKAYLYGGDFENYKTLCITEINELDDCRKIVGDNRSYGATPTHNAIDYVTKLHANTKGKKIIITITDGKPDLYDGHQRVYGIEDLLKLECKRALVEAEAKGFNVFGIGMDLDEIEYFKNMFRDEFINVQNASDIKKYLMDRLSDFVRSVK